jgi:hypothetical protein
VSKYRVVLVLTLAIVLAGATMGSDSCGTSTKTTADKGSSGGGGGTKEQAAKPATNEKPTPAEPDTTAGQEEALQSAQDYVDLAGISKAGLIQQLSSSAGEGFSKADATYAANHVGADWNAEAVESAKDYLDIGGMSKSSLYEQLTSSAGEKFTPAEAQYAVNKVYK